MGEVKYGDITYVSKKVSRIFYGTATMPLLTGENCNDQLDSIYSTGKKLLMPHAVTC